MISRKDDEGEEDAEMIMKRQKISKKILAFNYANRVDGNSYQGAVQHKQDKFHIKEENKRSFVISEM